MNFHLLSQLAAMPAMEKHFSNRMINYSKCKTLRMSDLKQIQIQILYMYVHRKMRSHMGYV